MVFNVKQSPDATIIQPTDELPYEFIKLEDIPIPMKDGFRLYAYIWIPKDAVDGKLSVPAVLEYIPYRKNDATAIRDSIRHPNFAANGFASIRVDLRGCGDSDGWLKDEYLKQEQDDCLEIFDWITAQPWSNGSIGMFGKSWGGFNSLQVAARQHPALKTIITLCSTDDRYNDDVHYRGGSLLASDMLWWASTMLVYSARPQDPNVVGFENWRKNWFERLNTPPNSIDWISHQTRDDYWKHGSICENNYQNVKVPVLAVGGWRDGYTNPILRMVTHLPNKDSKGIIGPWVHEYPEVATPGPRIGFQQIAMEWWSKYLSNSTQKSHKYFDLDQLNPLTVYIQDPSSIKDSYDYRAGKWVSLEYRPSNQKYLTYHIDGQGNLSKTETSKELDIKFTGIQEYGLLRGTWCPFGQEGDFPADQKIEDSKSTTFDTDFLENDIDLLGFPELNVSVSVDKPVANLSARLVDLYYENGLQKENVLLSWGILNLSHRNSHQFPEHLVPGKKYDINIKLDSLGIKVVKEHKLRLALSPTDWPQAWPTAETPIFTLYSGSLKLPFVEENSYKHIEFPSPLYYKPCDRIILRGEKRSRDVVYNTIGSTWTIEDFSDEGYRKLCVPGFSNDGIEFGSKNRNIWKIDIDDPLTAYNQCDWELNIGRDKWQVKLVSTSDLKADKDNFYLHNKLTAYENDGDKRIIDMKEVFQKEWNNTIKRNFI
ncbi:CocE/NonD family hydrolase ASCRUDRAFT_75608 [Ascoidea rubescens DSM 1968]|uniref:Xaa-Pro dipeptidyl-peptidase C-terminal domain-containing protein n=1 Tax=Ascoidea rubescens DSM 1968 TaxID=1344418 RepID=A0A1D2VJ20_9ASCO|nr:hypothetical protein ASCRUDRAFT_75608 [Ascoidea rubescens DSM 1968]ODV61619.1 hypothetical protein ASCRUDRAFT_75608 [Ascoidea rubescens DSM 1968]